MMQVLARIATESTNFSAQASAAALKKKRIMS